MNALEGGCTTAIGIPGTLAVASGQVSEMLAITTIAEVGDHIVSSPSLYGGTYNLFHYTLPKHGIEVTFVDDPDDLDQWRAAVKPEHEAVLRRDAGQPEERRLRHRRCEQGRPRRRCAADHRQHRADAVPHPPDRVGRRHRGALAHEVHRRPRHIDRWLDHRRRARSTSATARFPNFTEPDPSYHGLPYWPALGHGAFIFKARVQGLRDTGGSHLAVQRLPLPAGPRDVEPADGASLLQRRAGRRVPAEPRRGRERDLGRPAVEPVVRAGQEVRRRQGLRLA